MKPVGVKSSTFIDSSKEIKDKDPKIKFGDTVRISKYKNIFAKCYVPNWYKEVFVIKKVKNTVPWTNLISDLKGEEIVGTFYEKELRKTNQKEFRVNFTLGNCLFGSEKLTKNAFLDKHKYCGCGIGFDSRSEFSFADGSFGKYVIFFGDNMSSSVHIDTKGKDILNFDEGPTQGLDDTTLAAEAKYTINFTQSGKRFVSSLHSNGSNSFLFVNAANIYQSKQGSEIKDYALCLSNISKDFTINNMEKQN